MKVDPLSRYDTFIFNWWSIINGISMTIYCISTIIGQVGILWLQHLKYLCNSFSFVCFNNHICLSIGLVNLFPSLSLLQFILAFQASLFLLQGFVLVVQMVTNRQKLLVIVPVTSLSHSALVIGASWTSTCLWMKQWLTSFRIYIVTFLRKTILMLLTALFLINSRG